jgi:3-hydroxybutyryl-CoA dehydrogenase
MGGSTNDIAPLTPAPVSLNLDSDGGDVVGRGDARFMRISFKVRRFHQRIMENRNIVIMGPGRMGLGIALSFALHQFPVRVVDGKSRSSAEYERVRHRAKRELRSHLNFLRGLDYLEEPPEAILSRVSFHEGLNEAVLGGSCIFEAIPERPDLKVDLLRRISPYIRPNMIVASTTSTIDLKTLRRGFAHPERLLITHWLNPAFIIPLVEISRTDETDPQAVQWMKRTLKKVGKKPIVLKDSPGFIIPRIQALAMNEAVRILEEGVATAADIDQAIRYGFGFRLCVLGLLEFVDLGGLDILYYADKFLSSTFKGERFKVPRLIDEKMKKGETGPRTGKGIYDYRGKDINLLFRKKHRELIELLRRMEPPLRHAKRRRRARLSPRHRARPG